ncbi:alkaline phytoceramidase [Pseudovirgaria hyperparasitica]|uniref:Alkaline phytoceramidase n=1 Tax=Pseudovirgaria hyperparasitica TaxID=470096 RepID=A0A6A6WHA4_9PEZI|nr:alkaline phytoceramidase [Pseudovirgaria hyperparasitica]KAF2761599.1 alkaline phytoceramidase [Pseudovirgaria hyperparasitica]
MAILDMFKKLPSVPYPAPKTGYWLPVTSTLNWCEEARSQSTDYYATPYSAEIVNTLTNLLFIYLAILGVRSCLRNGHDTIFLVTFCGYFLVGSGSFAFHATLKYPMQLVDELSMIYTTCLMFWACFGHGHSRRFQVLLGIALFALAAFITLYYHYLQDPDFHQNAYAILTAIVLIRSMFVMEQALRPSSAKRKRDLADIESKMGKLSHEPTAELQRRDVRDRDILIRMWAMVGYGLFIFLLGFAIWNLDNEFCSTIRSWRHEIGLPWGILLEGHGWWHLMTGTGAYFYITWGVWLRHCLNGKQDEYEMHWPRLITSLPFVERIPRRVQAGNGASKKTI